MKKKKDEQLMARQLRSSGKSIKEISKTLSVSIGSVSTWVKDIVLTDEQITYLKDRNPLHSRQCKGAKSRKDNARSQRLIYQTEGKSQAKILDPLHISGCMLYWAEGSKSRNTCSFSNSDPNMLKLYLKFLKNCFNITNNDIKIYINCYTTNGKSIDDIETYWQQELDIPKSSFGKTTTDNLSIYSKKKSKNILLYGTLSIKVLKSTWLVQHIYGAIQEYTGVHNNYGLDIL